MPEQVRPAAAVFFVCWRTLTLLAAGVTAEGLSRVAQMVSDDENIKRTARSASDNDLLRPRRNDDDTMSSGGSKGAAASVVFDDTASNGSSGGIRSKRHHSAAAPAPAPPGSVAPTGAGGKTPKPPGWGKKSKSTRGLFFRGSSTPKTQDGESPPVPAAPRGPAATLGKGLASAAAAGTSVARKTFRSEST